MADCDFLQLPEELIYLIMKRMSFVKDFVRFGATCKSWESVVAEARRKTENPIFTPTLMLVNDDTDAQDLRTFSSLSTKREITVTLPDIHDRRCWGTPYGWLITFGLDHKFHPLNPFTGVRLPLPHHTSYPTHFPDQDDPDRMRLVYARRFALSSNPSLNQIQSCIVISIFLPRYEMYFARLGDEVWTRVMAPIRHFEDAIYFNGHIHGIVSNGLLSICDINPPLVRGTHIGSPLPFKKGWRDNFYLFDMSRELHLVVRFMKCVKDELSPMNGNWVTGKFVVYKFDIQAKAWNEVTKLEDCALFIGDNTSFVISTNEYVAQR